MKHNNLPTPKLFCMIEDLYRFKQEYHWDNKIIAKVLGRMYGIELSAVEVGELWGKLGR